MAKIDFKENGSKGVESSKNGAQKAKEWGKEQAKAIAIPFCYGTLQFEDDTAAKNFLEQFSFHNIAVAEALVDELENFVHVDMERATRLIFANRDFAKAINDVSKELGDTL